MVLNTRPIAPVTVTPNTLSASPAGMLDAVEGQRLVGLLSQIRQLSDYASQIFTNLYEDATIVASRTKAIKQRVLALDTLVPQVIQHLESAPPSSFYTQSTTASTFVRAPAPHVEQLNPSTKPAAITAARDVANPPPNLSLLDALSGKQCALGYSDPSFFLNHWIRQQEENMAKSAQDNKAKKEKRRKKREAKVVEAVQQLTIKTYSAQGKEFESSTPSNKQPQLVPVSQLHTTPIAPRVSQTKLNDIDEGQRVPQPVFAPTAPPIIDQPPVAPSPVHYQAPAAPVPPPFTPAPMPSFHEQPEAPPAAPTFHETPAPPVDVPQPPLPSPVHARAPSMSTPPLPPPTHVRAPSLSGQNITPVRAPPPLPVTPSTPVSAAPVPPRTPQQLTATPPIPNKFATPPPPPQAPSVMRTPPPPPAGLAAVPPPMSPPFGAVDVPDAPDAPPMAPSFTPPEAPSFTSSDAPMPPPPPSAPAPPSAPSAPSAPRVAPVAAAGGRDALLDAIKGGARLRKAEPAAAAAAPAPERGGLLGEIKNRNFQLRSVDRTKVEEQKKAVPPPAAAGGLNSIMDVLARRQAIVGDDSDSDSDSDDWET